MDKETFDRFIHFGAIGYKKSRKQIANNLFPTAKEIQETVLAL